MRDVIIIGGSYAGLSAALQLGRARRDVLVLDAGKPRRRNRFAAHSHGFLGQDGQTPDAIVAQGKREVLAYSTVTWREAAATAVARQGSGFIVHAAGEALATRRVIIASGVRDELPALPGFAERWGQTIFHCPYCHGYELNRGPLGVVADGPFAAHFATLVADWSTPGNTSLFLGGDANLDAEQTALLTASQVRVERTPVVAADGDAPFIRLRLRDGRATEPLAGVFLKTHLRPADDFASQLGCELSEGPAGSFYKTDMTKETTVPGRRR
ncbi:MAG: NAD(P)/FAD-dependent oxidoreductase [Polyangiales bacterium]